MKFWNQYPLLRLLLPIVFGILIAYYFSEFQISIIIPLSISIVFFIWVLFSHYINNYSSRFIGGTLVAVLFFLLGFFLTRSHQEKMLDKHYSNEDDITHFLVRIDAPFSSTQQTHKTIGKILGVKTINDSIAKPSYGKLLLYFQKKDTLLLQYGDELIVSAHHLSPIRNMGNPHEFDYKAYLARHQIFDQLYLVKTDWLKTGNNSSKLLSKWSYQVRDRLISILNSYQFSKENFAVASAILVGYDEYLDQDLRQLYAGSGAMHILCVSGLHVGIIFLILNVLLKPLERKKSTRYIKTILIILMIWFYALVTGMSPSVFRAATMFSFISLGQMINRRTSVYNSLAASAVVLILANPFVIFHIGFQLSYSAILGILFIQPMISSWVNINNIVGKYLWDLLAVSIAAQIGTFPISVFYFHQFPNYFFLTNLFVIPASFIILITGFATLVFDLLGLSTFIAFFWLKDLLDLLLDILNTGVDWINQIPFSVSTDLFLTAYDVWLLYLFIGLFIAAIMHKNMKALAASFSIFIVLMIYDGTKRIASNSDTIETLTVYNIPKNAILELNKGVKSIFFMDSLTLLNNAHSRYVKGNILQRRVKQEEMILLDTIVENPSIVQIGKWKLLIMDHVTKLPKNKVNVDYLWIRNNPQKKPFLIFEEIKPKTVLYDASNNYWNAEKWQLECEKLDIEFYNLNKKGAFIAKTP